MQGFIQTKTINFQRGLCENGICRFIQWNRRFCIGGLLGWIDIEKDAQRNTDFPAAWLNGTWENGIPRVASGIKNRVNRLKCLGNAIVPQCAELIFNLPAFDLWRRA